MGTKDQLKIFIVDDDPFCLGMYQQHLVNAGYKKPRTFSNGQDCLNRLTEQPDIILLDHQMEPYNGLEVLKKIKRVNPDIYLLLISGQDDMQVAINALKYGAFDYIIKGDGDLQKITQVLEKIEGVVDLLNGPQSMRWKKVFSFLNII